MLLTLCVFECQIIALAIVYSVLCKKPEKDEYEPAEIELREDEVYMHEDDMASAEDMNDAKKRMAIMKKLQRTRNALPPQMQLLQNARELRFLFIHCCVVHNLISVLLFKNEGTGHVGTDKRNCLLCIFLIHFYDGGLWRKEPFDISDD